MTDRLKGVVVTFETDIREDDAAGIIDAIKRLRHVASVTPSVSNFEDAMNRGRVRWELQRRLWDVLNKKEEGDA